MTDSRTLEAQIGYTFKDPEKLALALTHASCEFPTGHNQRLEFLGDAVLDLVIAEALYQTYDSIDEGTMDRVRASIVNGKSLAKKAVEIGLSMHLQVSDGHREHHPEPSHAMLEDALEAIFGAIFLDGGMDAARATILKLFGDRIQNADISNQSKNPKGQLQEWAQQAHAGLTPEYHELAAEGPDHHRHYQASVSIKGALLAKGSGTSKKAAESDAAKNALKLVIR
ncbi:MAG TPA: ribonuclease III [Opitutae bacterium]|nr:ribonuclease III [Opitutae bacterium]